MVSAARQAKATGTCKEPCAKQAHELHTRRTRANRRARFPRGSTALASLPLSTIPARPEVLDHKIDNGVHAGVAHPALTWELHF